MAPVGRKKKKKKTAVSADLSGDLLHEENPEGLDILLHLWADQEFGSQRQTRPQTGNSDHQYSNETGYGGHFFKRKDTESANEQIFCFEVCGFWKFLIQLMSSRSPTFTNDTN